MGTRFFDQYSLLHFATGVIAYFFSIRFSKWFAMHAIFEYVENQSWAISFINNHLSQIWPGGKPYPDSIINMIGDQIFSLFGWIVANMLDEYATRKSWYMAN